MNKVELTKEQELAIAEFIFALSTDTLIISEVTKCLDVLRKTNLMSAEQYMKECQKIDMNVVVLMQDILDEKILVEQGKELMAKYTSGKL